MLLQPEFSAAHEVLACWGTHMLGYSHVGALVCRLRRRDSQGGQGGIVWVGGEERHCVGWLVRLAV